ncbi:hypothetical protein HPB51_001296 [Rhipicephalus microplus]|uniref:Uncharacterized protein n=1 Tax=Rhipicephalus microplus TaxID=6941 RepID=A0A9J6E4T8_RHIMP|nr:hypothetical protein HPB51_001296 [Rhipicephalus microplus]
MASPVSTIESAAMDAADTNEYPEDLDDGSWFTATRRRKPKTTTNSAPEPLPAKNQVTLRPPPLPVEDFKVFFRPRGGLRLKYRCYIHRSRKQVCTIYLAFGHRAGVCPTPTKRRCQACGVETPVPAHSCTTECFHCKGDHPATHPKYPAREQKPPNKHYVKKALEANALAPPSTSPPKGHQDKQSCFFWCPLDGDIKPRSRTRCSQSKSRGKSQDKAMEYLNNTPGTTPKTSITLGLVSQKNRAAGAERPESPPAKKPALAGQTAPAKFLFQSPLVCVVFRVVEQEVIDVLVIVAT